MKQVIIGCFGMCLMLGLLITEWSLYSLSVRRQNMIYSVRAIERIVENGSREAEKLEEAKINEEAEGKDEGEAVDKAELVKGRNTPDVMELIERELEARLTNGNGQYEIVLMDGEQKLQLHIWDMIPYGVKGRKIEVYKELAY